MCHVARSLACLVQSVPDGRADVVGCLSNGLNRSLPRLNDLHGGVQGSLLARVNRIAQLLRSCLPSLLPGFHHIDHLKGSCVTRSVAGLHDILDRAGRSATSLVHLLLPPMHPLLHLLPHSLPRL